MKTFDVHFIDAKDGCGNHKILQANSAQDIQEYMAELGHTQVKISERK